LKGEEIDINARIFAVADAFDAMTSDRVYRAGRGYELAAAELEAFSGRQFDPHVVEAFRRVPREDWEELRRASVGVRHSKAQALAAHACAPASPPRRDLKLRGRAPKFRGAGLH
jgi:HD-GYP domain-containing protein (c-di-GMP phosphodiesterase class II)